MSDDRFKDLPGVEGFRFRHVDDGDPHVYIKTTWGSLAILAVIVMVLGHILIRGLFG